MSRRASFALGLAYGISVGVALRGVLDYAEAQAHNVRRPNVPPVKVELDGADVERALLIHRRRTGRGDLS